MRRFQILTYAYGLLYGEADFLSLSQDGHLALRVLDRDGEYGFQDVMTFAPGAWRAAVPFAETDQEMEGGWLINLVDRNVLQMIRTAQREDESGALLFRDDQDPIEGRWLGVVAPGEWVCWRAVPAQED